MVSLEKWNHSAEMPAEDPARRDPDEALWFSNLILLKACQIKKQ